MQETPLEAASDSKIAPGYIPECIVISDSDDECSSKSSYLCPSSETQNSSLFTSTNYAVTFNVKKGFSSLPARSPVNPLKRNQKQALLEDYDMFHNYKCSSQPAMRSPLKTNSSPSPKKIFQRRKLKYSPQKFCATQVPNQASVKSFFREISPKPVEVITVVGDEHLPHLENVSDKLSAMKSVQHLAVPGKNDYSHSPSFYESSHSSKENIPNALNICNCENNQCTTRDQFNGGLAKAVSSPGIYPADFRVNMSSLMRTDEHDAAVITNMHTNLSEEMKECAHGEVKKHIRNLFRDVKSEEAIRGQTDCSSGGRSVAVSSTGVSNYSIESYNKVMDTVDSILVDLGVEPPSSVLPEAKLSNDIQQVSAKISEMKVTPVLESLHRTKREHERSTFNWKFKREIDNFPFQKPKTELLIRLRDDLMELPDLENCSNEINLSAERKQSVKTSKSSCNSVNPKNLQNISSVISQLKTDSNGIKAFVGSNTADYKMKCEGSSPIECNGKIMSSTKESKCSKSGSSVSCGFKCCENESLSLVTSGSEKYHKIKLNINVPSVKYQRRTEPLPKQYKQYLKIMKIWFDESDRDGGSVANGLQGLQEFTTYTTYPPIEFVPQLLQLLRQNQNSQLAYETLLHFLRFNGVNKEVDWWKEIEECMKCLNPRKEPPSETDSRNNIFLLHYVLTVLTVDIESFYVMPNCFTLMNTLAHKHLLGSASDTSRVIALVEWLALLSGKTNSLATSLSVVDILSDFLTLAVLVSPAPLTTATSAGKRLYGHYKNADRDGRCKLLDCLRDHLLRYKTLQPFVIEDLAFRVQSALLAYPVTIWTLMDPAQYVDATRNLDEVAHVMKYVVLDYAVCWTEQLHLPVNKRTHQDLPNEERDILSNVDDRFCILQNHLARLYSLDRNSATWQQLLWQLKFLS